MTGHHWVIGSGGLLGAAVVHALRRHGEPVLANVSIDWATTAAPAQLERGLNALIDEADGSSWAVYWCAGAATTSSPADALEAEIDTLRGFLGAVATLPPEVLERGTVFFASSAGGVYGGSDDAPFDETSRVAPLGDYGRAKLVAEAMIRRLGENTATSVLIGRIANLYGPGQNTAKLQGLVSRLCLTTLTRAPLPVFVSIDTLRDYIYADDAAELTIRSTARASEAAARVHLKIIASGRSVSVGALISQFAQITRRRPTIVWAQSAQSSLQGRDLRVRSIVWPDLDDVYVTPLADGIARTLQALRHEVALGRYRRG